ncbi:MAG TPA: MOSC domain-containing protein, partial [Caulobacteraceae bacterium]|nr:MOSC domain-containing protein [Caulobacteraceae bacterium]
DGRVVGSEAGAADSALSELFGRRVRLATAAPEDFTIDMQVASPDDAPGHGGSLVQQKLGAAYFAQAGAPSPVPATAFFDLFPLSVITTATLAHLQALQPGSLFDSRRFRMNLVVESPAEGFVENAWLGRRVSVGGAALQVTMADPRCVMTTLAQDDLPQDLEVLRAVAAHNSLPFGGGDAKYPCAGVYAVVTTPGDVTIGAPITLDG